MHKHSKPFYTAIFIITVVLLIGLECKTTQASEDITTLATGVAIVQGNNIAGAREEATRDALRQALEQSVGMLVESYTILNNDDLTEKIYTDTHGYIKSYEIISQEKKSNGLYSVKVKAIVKTGALRNTLANLGIIKAMMGYPRVLIIPEPNIKISPEIKLAESVLIRQFTDKRFDLVDQAKSLQLHYEAGRLLGTKNTADIAAGIGLQHNAELVILFNAVSLPGEFDGLMENVPVSMQSKVIVTSTAQVLAAEQLYKTGLGRGHSQARDNGIRITSEKMADSLINKIVTWWADYTANGIPYNVTLQTKPGEDRKVLAFQQAIESIPGVVSLSERSSDSGITEMTVKYKGNTRDLRKEIFAVTEMKSGFSNLQTEASKGIFLVFSAL